MKIKRYQTIEDLLFELLAFSIPFECRGFLEAKLDGLEVLCEFRDLRSDFLWIFLVKDDFLEKSRNDFHVAFFHAEARDFAGAETDTPRIHVCPTLLGVPGEQVPVHDDSRFFKSFLDVCAEAEALLQTGNVEHHLMRFRVTLVLAQWLETRGSESLGKSFCILDDLPVIFLTEFKHFREVMANPATLCKWWLLSMDGKQAFLIFSSRSSGPFVRMQPCCGPGKVLCVDNVKISAPSSSGCWKYPLPIKPATCAPS